MITETLIEALRLNLALVRWRRAAESLATVAAVAFVLTLCLL